MDDNTTQTDRARGLHSLTEAEWEQKMIDETPPVIRRYKIGPHKMELVAVVPIVGRWRRFKNWLFGRP